MTAPSPPFSAITASSSIDWYNSKPTSLIWPDCSSPSRLPAPLMSRSWLASMKPAPSVGGDGDIGVGPDLGAADAPAQLIELGEPEHVGVVHDQRVGGGDVEARLDDRGRQQHVVLPVVEGVHHRIE